MPKCSFCNRDYDHPKGMTIVRIDGSVKYFCSSKCRKNWKMGRNKKKVKWVIKEKK